MTLFNNIPSAQEYKVLRQQYQMQIQKLSNIFNKQCKIINQLDAEKRDLEAESSNSPSGETILMQSQYFNKSPSPLLPKFLAEDPIDINSDSSPSAGYSGSGSLPKSQEKHTQSSNDFFTEQSSLKINQIFEYPDQELITMK